jgi:hypothetical protein
MIMNIFDNIEHTTFYIESKNDYLFIKMYTIIVYTELPKLNCMNECTYRFCEGKYYYFEC